MPDSSAVASDTASQNQNASPTQQFHQTNEGMRTEALIGELVALFSLVDSRQQGAEAASRSMKVKFRNSLKALFEIFSSFVEFFCGETKK